MPKHGEKIHKRKDGRWEGRYKTGTTCQGKTKYSSVYGKTYAEVKKKLTDVHSGELFSFNRSNVSFSYVTQQWFLTYKHKFKKSTAHKYEFLITKHILPDLGALKIQKITVIDLNNFAEIKLDSGGLNSSKKLSKSYVRSIMLIVNSIMNFAAQEGLCMPLKSKIYKPIPDKKELIVLNSNELKLLEERLESDFSLTAIGTLIAMKTGLRIGEVCALTWDDIDFENKILHVRNTVSRVRNESDLKSKTKLILDTPKTTSSLRDIPFTDSLDTILKTAFKTSTSKFIISDNEAFVSPRTFEYRYHALLRKYDLPDVNFHVLRHSFATRCIECGVDVKSLSEILGHSNVSITLNTYVHSSIEMKRKQLEKIFEA